MCAFSPSEQVVLALGVILDVAENVGQHRQYLLETCFPTARHAKQTGGLV
jgi:hypothetical protein